MRIFQVVILTLAMLFSALLSDSYLISPLQIKANASTLTEVLVLASTSAPTQDHSTREQVGPNPDDLEHMAPLHRHHEHEHGEIDLQEAKNNPFYFLGVEERTMPFRMFRTPEMISTFALTLFRFSLAPLAGLALLILLKRSA